MKLRKKTENKIIEIDASSDQEAEVQQTEELEKINSNEVHVLFDDLGKKLARDHRTTVKAVKEVVHKSQVIKGKF